MFHSDGMSEVMPLVGSEVRGLQVNQVSGAMLASGAKTQHFQLILGDKISNMVVKQFVVLCSSHY